MFISPMAARARECLNLDLRPLYLSFSLGEPVARFCDQLIERVRHRVHAANYIKRTAICSAHFGRGGENDHACSE